MLHFEVFVNKFSSMSLLNEAWVPYSGLFSLGVNFHEFHKWTHNSGKFYSELLRLWVAIVTVAEIVPSVCLDYFSNECSKVHLPDPRGSLNSKILP